MQLTLVTFFTNIHFRFIPRLSTSPFEAEEARNNNPTLGCLHPAVPLSLRRSKGVPSWKRQAQHSSTLACHINLLQSSPRPLFVYGTLIAAPLLAWVLTGSKESTELVATLTRPAILGGFKRSSLDGYDYPPLVPSEQSDTVEGRLLRPQTLSQRQKLDNFEGETYKITPVKVTCDGMDVEADAYVWDGDPDRVCDEPWDLRTFLDTRLEDWLDIFEGMEILDDEGN